MRSLENRRGFTSFVGSNPALRQDLSYTKRAARPFSFAPIKDLIAECMSYIVFVDESGDHNRTSIVRITHYSCCVSAHQEK